MNLIEKNVYKIKNKKTSKIELAVFGHWGQTGYAIFHPLGEPSFQDLFLIDDLNDYEIEWVRVGDSDDLGYQP